MLRIVYTKQATEDKIYWEKHDKKILQRIDELVNDIQRQPFSGIGKPEPLRFNKTGYWSRRITREHRLVYKIHDDVLYIAQCRYHY